jgi:hypothetical protein
MTDSRFGEQTSDYSYASREDARDAGQAWAITQGYAVKTAEGTVRRASDASPVKSVVVEPSDASFNSSTYDFAPPLAENVTVTTGSGGTTYTGGNQIVGTGLPSTTADTGLPVNLDNLIGLGIMALVIIAIVLFGYQILKGRVKV